MRGDDKSGSLIGTAAGGTRHFPKRRRVEMSAASSLRRCSAHSRHFSNCFTAIIAFLSSLSSPQRSARTSKTDQTRPSLPVFSSLATSSASSLLSGYPGTNQRPCVCPTPESAGLWVPSVCFHAPISPCAPSLLTGDVRTALADVTNRRSPDCISRRLIGDRRTGLAPGPRSPHAFL